MQPLEEYLEKRGAKYFVTVLMMFYVLGTVIFNIYLRSIGLYQFDLLQLRYMFVGFTFAIFTMIIPVLLMSIKRIIWGKGEDWTKKEQKEREKIQNKIEKIVLVLFVPWVVVYALYIFPLISPGFGGAKPITARLIGSEERIQRINTVIAFETGVDVETLPYETYNSSGLAAGANVQIIDQNKDRYLLLLTKDLYLSSQSRVAKKLIESGEGGDKLITENTKSFKSKPLVVFADGIETITLSLYEPPEVLTKTDLELATRVLADNRSASSGKTVTEALREVEPESADTVIAAVTQSAKVIQEKKKLASQPENNPSQAVVELDFSNVSDVLNQTLDTDWILARSDLFNKATYLQTLEKTEIREPKRDEFIDTVKLKLQTFFPEAYVQLSQLQESYLMVGAEIDPEFSFKMVEAIRGADSAATFVARLNALEYIPPVITLTDFIPVKEEALSFFDASVLANDTAANRKYIRQKLIQHFQTKAPNATDYWKNSLYLEQGSEDEGFAVKLKTSLEESTDWESFKEALESLWVNKDLDITEEADTPLEEEKTPEVSDSTSSEEETSQDTTNSDPVPTEEGGTSSTSPTEPIPEETTPAESDNSFNEEPIPSSE